MAIPLAVLAPIIGSVLSSSMNSASAMRDNMMNFAFNKHFQEDSQRWSSKENQLARDFNSAEALKAREFSAEEALKAREFSSIEAQKARDFEEEMSSTSYQRAIADMKAAGINPASIGIQGGASTPSASVPNSSSASSFGATSGSIGAGMSSFGAVGVADISNNAFIRALANDKSFQEDLIRNMSHSAQDSITKSSVNPMDLVDGETRGLLLRAWRKQMHDERLLPQERRAMEHYNNLVAGLKKSGVTIEDGE